MTDSIFAFFTNYTNNNATDFDAQLVRPQDVSVDAVMTSLCFNSIVFVILMVLYECLRRLLPTVYSSRQRLHRIHRYVEDEDDLQTIPEDGPPSVSRIRTSTDASCDGSSALESLPDHQPLDWVGPVFGVPWKKVRKVAGLDGYFFLRFLRMNVRITAVSTFWFFVILVPMYYHGHNPTVLPHGWYRISMLNIPTYGWRMWVSCIMAYLFSAFVGFVIKQEYRHYVDLRQEFLARGSAHVDPQHHYSLVVENVPHELRSDRALKEYFENLFPGKIHSACVVMEVPDLEEVSRRCVRTCRRLEKSIALYHATGVRPTHIVGQGRLSVLGVDCAPFDCTAACRGSADALVFSDDAVMKKPAHGAKVDSISYYTQVLSAHSRELMQMQQVKAAVAESGNIQRRAQNWLDIVAEEVTALADSIMDESLEDNALTSSSQRPGARWRDPIPQAERMKSGYGSFNTVGLHDHRLTFTFSSDDGSDRRAGLLRGDHLEDMSGVEDPKAPFSSQVYGSRLRRWAGRLGLDFAVSVFRGLKKMIESSPVVVKTMSSTGFVTFLDLSSTTCAVGAPLSAKATVLNVSVAPNPKEILWMNAHIPINMQKTREQIVTVVLSVGIVLWSFPLAAIQVFAKAESLAQIPGMEWILSYNGGALKQFVNGYLPVVALLGLILILPLIFESIAVYYERRKTFSDVQASIMSRYFNYQLANIYVSVTAGSILKSLADIINHPSGIFRLFGESLPTMVGYFIALLVTKIMAGLPMIFLRFGALTRMLFLRILSSEKKLTQRELDAVYRLENVQYGWEFPAQLLSVVIIFTYAIICPVILPFGLIYFVGALIVYKKQVLYVYSPVYESGAQLFPLAVQGMMTALVCGQLTLLGYTVIRGCYYHPLFLVPLPLFTIYGMDYFQRTYADSSIRLSLERARAYDSRYAQRQGNGTESEGDAGVEARRLTFDKNAYRQPVLTELANEPLTYRRGKEDKETMTVRKQLRRLNSFVTDNSVPQSEVLPSTELS